MGTLLIFLTDLAGAAMMTVLLTWLGGMLVRLLSGEDPPGGGGGGGGWRWQPQGPGPRPQPQRAHGRRDPLPPRPRGRLKLPR